jgi:DNA-binding transcriptional LysR family regulator
VKACSVVPRLLTRNNLPLNRLLTGIQESMLDRGDLLLLLAVRSHGRIAAAAEQLGVTAAAVSKRLAAIERGLGVKLFLRTTRRMSASDEGELCATLAMHLLEGFEDLEAQVTARSERISGTIRLLSNAGFGRVHLAPPIAAFQAQYPQIAVELHLSNVLPDLQAEGLDAAVWLWAPTSSQYVVSKLAANHRIVVASPEYVRRHGKPKAPQDLAKHQCLVMAQRDAFDRMWRLQKIGRSEAARKPAIDVKIKGALRSNSGEVVRDWAIGGHGIALRPLWDVAEHVRSGALVDMLPGYAQFESDVKWLAPFRSNIPRRLVLLKEWLQHAFARPGWT